jgi:hypothetical protein
MYSESIDYLYTLYRAQDFDPLDKFCIFPLRITNRYGDQSYCGLAHENAMKNYHEPDRVNQMFDKSDTIVDFLDRFFSEWAESQGKSRWAEKTPNNIFCMDQWLAAFPDGMAIIPIRDGRDVVLSLNIRRSTPIYMGAYRWIAAANKYDELRNGDYAGRVIPVYYEELVTRTEEVLEQICVLLGEQFYPGMLDFWKKESSKEDGGLKYGTTPVTDERVGMWKKRDYDQTILHQIMIAIKPQMEQLGYEID